MIYRFSKKYINKNRQVYLYEWKFAFTPTVVFLKEGSPDEALIWLRPYYTTYKWNTTLLKWDNASNVDWDGLEGKDEQCNN